MDDKIKKKLLYSWITNINFYEGLPFDPYPISLRTVNIIKWLLDNKIKDKIIIDSLVLQSRFLSNRLEKHLLANHYFSNAKALFFIGIYLNSKEADKWHKKGKKIILEQIEEQILDDGAHFELSPMYHNLFIQDILDLLIINKGNHEKFDKFFEENLIEKLKKMIYWAKTMSHPDGEVPFFNDSGINVAPRIDDLQRFAIENFSIPKFEKKQVIYHQPSNYFVMDMQQYKAILDIAEIGANYNPGHAHADTLSFELSIGGNRAIINSGISTYENTSLRHFQRSTAAHSTVEVADKNSSDVWGSFRVGNRASTFDVQIQKNKESTLVSASHDGYKDFHGCIHKRSWYFEKNLIRVRDTLKGNNVKSSGRLFLHPKVQLKEIINNIIFLSMPTGTFKISIINNDFKLIQSNYYKSFGFSENNACILVDIKNNISEIEIEILNKDKT